MSSVPYPVFCQHLIGTISGFQVYAKMDPVTYLSFNHEKARKLALVVNIMVFTGECVFVAIKYGTLCAKADVAVIQSLTGLQLALKTTQVLSLYSVLIGFLPRVVYYCVSKMQRKSNPPVTLMFASTRFVDNVGTRNLDTDVLNDVMNETAGQSKIETESVPSTSDKGKEEQNIIIPNDESFLEVEKADVPTVARRSSTVAADRSNHGINLLRNNQVGPENVPRTRNPYILDFRFVTLLVGIFLSIGIVVVAILSPAKWWINIYVINLLTFILMVYWLHSSEEISDYAMRKLIQLYGDNI